MCVCVFSYSFPLWFITGYWIWFLELYSRTLWFIHSLYTSLHLLIPSSQSNFLPTPPTPLGNHQSSFSVLEAFLDACESCCLVPSTSVDLLPTREKQPNWLNKPWYSLSQNSTQLEKEWYMSHISYAWIGIVFFKNMKVEVGLLLYKGV